MSVDGGGCVNYSVLVVVVGVIVVQLIYYMLQNDLVVIVYYLCGVEVGLMCGYGILQIMVVIEMMVDEIVGWLGVDVIDLCCCNVLCLGMKNIQGVVLVGVLCLYEIFDKVVVYEVWKDCDVCKKCYDVEDLDNWYGVGFVICQKDFGIGVEVLMVSIEFSVDGCISLCYIGIEIGIGMFILQVFVVGDFFGCLVDEVKIVEIEWFELWFIIKGNFYLMSQVEQDVVLCDLCWVGKLVLLLLVINLVFYFSYVICEVVCVLFNYGLWLVVLELWCSGLFGGQVNFYVVCCENVVWVDGQLIGNGLVLIFFVELVKKVYEMGLVIGVSVYGFNCWSWVEVDFVIDGVCECLLFDVMVVKYGDGVLGVKKVMMNSVGFYLFDWQNLVYLVIQLNNVMVIYYSLVVILVELKVNKGSGEVQVFDYYFWIECGWVLVLELVKGQLEGGIVMGIGYVLLEEMLFYEGGFVEGDWNFNCY